MSREQFERGAYDALEKSPAYYGCHFGMHSTLERDKASYFAGYEFAKEWLAGKGAYANVDFDTAICSVSIK